MKVRHLFSILQEENPDLDVKIANDEECNEIFHIKNIIVSDDNSTVIIIPDEFKGILQ